MADFTGQRHSERVLETLNCALFRETHEADSGPRLVKRLKIPDERGNATFRDEFEIANNLAGLDCTLKPLALDEENGALELVFENFEGGALDPTGFMDRHGLAGFLRLSINLARAVAAVHRCDVIHRNLEIQSILFREDDFAVKLHGFRLRSFHEATCSSEDPATLLRNLRYLAPEQTGRINWPVDHRSDFYVMGLVLYELMTGQAPFDADDPMEMAHAHLAKTPRPPRELRQDIPSVLSDIALKLLSKTPEDRYQNGLGLIADLERCRKQLEDHGKIAAFAIGGRDVSGELHIPHKLYGRENELARIMGVYEEARQGLSRLMPLTGASGMGKSELIGAVQEQVVARRGYFIAGKYDPHQRGLPYQGYVDAFRGLISQLLAETPEQVDRWRERLMAALGVNAGVIVDVLPDLALILGETEPAPELGVEETRNRFRLTLIKFIRVFARRDRPLVLFLDDMQWAGVSSRELTNALFEPEAGLCLFIICAYRKDAVSGEHPLCQMIGELRKVGVATPDLELRPLDLVHVQAMLRDALGCEPRHSKALASAILNKTEGNPFYLAVYLKSLCDRDLLRFNAKTGRWEWDLDRIRADRTESEGMLELVLKRVSRLPVGTQDALKLGSCIGVRFGLHMLSMALCKSQFETASLLAPAVKDGVLVAAGDAFRALQMGEAAGLDPNDAQDHGVYYQFMHSRIQEAVYTLMDREKSQENHLLVGKQMLKRIQAHDLERDIFSVVNQLNFGREFIDSLQERLQLARLNLEAGRKARNANAFVPAREFLTIGLALLPAEAEERERELWFELSLALAEVESLGNNHRAAGELFRALRHGSRTTEEKARVYSSQILMLNNLSQLDMCVALGLEGLHELDVPLPDELKGLEAEIAKARAAVREYLDRRGVESLAALPEASDPVALARAQLLASVTPSAFNTNRELFELLALRQVLLAFEHGSSPFAPYSFAVLGVLMGMVGDFAAGFDLGRMAARLSERYTDPLVLLRVKTVCCNFLNHWRRHFSENMPILAELQNETVAHGDLAFANYNNLVSHQHRWLLNDPLLSVLDDGLRYVAFAGQTQNVAVREALRFFNQAALNLRGLTDAANSLASADFDETASIALLRDAGYMTGLTGCRVVKAEVLYLRGFYREAWAAIGQAEETERFNENTLMITQCWFYRGLIAAALWRRAPQEERAALGDSLEAACGLFRKWAENCPENFQCRLGLLNAESARIHERPLEALGGFLDAAREADRQGFALVAALAHERALRLCRSRGYVEYAGFHLQAALERYGKWGASAKAADLRDECADLREPRPVETDSAGELAASQALDMTTMLKAAQALSGEIQTAKLIDKLMRFLMENAGAQRGLLIMLRDGRLAVEAESDAASGETKLYDGLLIERRDDLPKPVIHFVSRTKADLVIDDLSADKQFVSDPYLRGSGVKSLLCMPILRGSELVGILCLENQLVKGAFSGRRLEMLRMLSPQIAISLENARFVDEMTELNRVLREEIQVRKEAEAALQKAQEVAVQNARKAGKAEFATSVLHNIKNVLNSVWLARAELGQLLEDSKIPQLGRCIGMMAERRQDLGAYLDHDPKGRLVLPYLEKVHLVLQEDQERFVGEMEALAKSLSLMKDIIETQQAHAKGALLNQAVSLLPVIDDALRTQGEAIARHRIRVFKEFEVDGFVRAEKTRLTHILINLVKNAVEAMGLEEGDRDLTLSTGLDQNGCAYLRVADTGMGIAPKDLENLFSHGFTTKEFGHGFGLNYCAKVMKEMGGHLRAESEGRGKGAAFTLTFAPSEDA